MALYSYVKKKHLLRKKIVIIVAIILIFLGISLLIGTLLPIISFEIFYAPKFNQLVQPMPDNLFKQALDSEFSQMLGTRVDYTRASAWFPKAVTIKPNITASSSYTLSIPKLGIDNVQVLVGSEDLSKSLIHFSGPLPGNYGNSIIFGHSTIPWLYNPKDYKTIFSKLPNLKNGDEIFIYVDQITYRYQIIEMKIVFPDDLSALSQTYDSPIITLVTCVPPGTYLKRLLVKGKLIAN